MKIDRKNPSHWYYLGLQGLFTLAVIIIRPFLRRTEKRIIILYGHQFSGHLAAIYNYWHTHATPDFTFFFLSLNPSPILGRMADVVNTLYCVRFKDMLVVARSTAMITDHGLHMMFPLVKLTDIEFFDVGHGIPFKGYDQDDFRVQHNYKEIWTSSMGISDLYARKCGCGDLVYSIGAPRTDKLVESGNRGSDFRKFANVPVQNPIILYAPTWQQDDRGRGLVPFGQDEEEFLGRLSTFCKEKNCYLVFRSHQNASFLERPYDRVFYCPQVEYPDTEDILLETNILISDWSSIVFDYLLLNRPTIFLDVPHPFAKGCTLGPEYRFGHVVPDLDELTEALGEYVDHPDRYWARYGERHRAIQEFTYDNNADGRTSERCLNRLQELLS